MLRKRCEPQGRRQSSATMHSPEHTAPAAEPATAARVRWDCWGFSGISSGVTFLRIESDSHGRPFLIEKFCSMMTQFETSDEFKRFDKPTKPKVNTTEVDDSSKSENKEFRSSAGGAEFMMMDQAVEKSVLT